MPWCAINAPMIDAAALGFPILRQTAADLVVIKPAGIATELTTDPRKSSLISKIRKVVPEGVTPRLVHRLDRVTRGVMIVTLTREAAAFYGEQIREGLWEKYYLARIPMPAKKDFSRVMGEHKAYIKEEDNRAKLVKAGGKASFLEVLAIEPAPDRPGEAHALIKLLTGRLHQIRVMLAGLGVPLIADDFYGGAMKSGASMYLEHVMLWYLDYSSREIMLGHLEKDPGRERLAPGMAMRLRQLSTPG